MTDICTLDDFINIPREENTLRLMSFNMQVGIQTTAYHHYLLKSWQHILPSKTRQLALIKIANLIKYFDFVALQEADAGSLRSSKLNQVEYLAKEANFSHFYQQVNRNLGTFAKHSNGLLSQFKASKVEQYPLPGLLPGRGVMIIRFGDDKEECLTVVVTHLALDLKTQFKQLAFVAEKVKHDKYVVIMGDLNQEAKVLLNESPLNSLKLNPLIAHATYPSWQPQKGLDHILLSDSINLKRIAVINQPLSDHLPVAAEIELPFLFS